MKGQSFSSRRPLLLGFMTLAVLVVGLLGWGVFGVLSGAVIATGRIEVAVGDQIVEHVDGGQVAEILAGNGDRVAAGAVLIRLDDELLRSEEAVLQAELSELVARRNRLEAEFRDAEAIVWDAEIAGLAASHASVGEILSGQQRLFEARRSSREGLMAQLRERIGQTERQIAGLTAQAGAVKRLAALTAQELQGQRALLDKGLAALDQVLPLEREAAELEGQSGAIEAQIAEARGRIAELEIQIRQISTRRVEETEAQAREVYAHENRVRERLAALRVRLERLAIRAPVTGTVHGITVFALGEVLRPGEPVAHIVPDEESGLIAKAQLEPIYVDQVYPGQQAVLRFSAFPARTTPEYEGRITRISADAMYDERTGLSWYDVVIALGAPIAPRQESALLAWVTSLRNMTVNWLRSLGGRGDVAQAVSGRVAPALEAAGVLTLTPGMPVEIYLRTGERSPISYLAKPLTDFFSRSLREE